MAVVTTRSGVLAFLQAVTGAGLNVVEPDSNLSALHIQGVASGATMTWTIEQSLDGGTTWAVVNDPGSAVAVTDVPLPITILNRSAALRIDNPVGQYRTNVTAISAGTFTAFYLFGPERR